MNWTVPLSDLDYGPEEDQAVLDVLHSKWLTMGAVAQAFEAEFAALHAPQTGAIAPGAYGSALPPGFDLQAVAVSNATQALHLACLALGVGPGDEVIVPSLTFVATANAVLYTGAQVRFADVISPAELTIDPAEIDRLYTPRTKAVIVMHYAGYPCRMAEIVAKAKKYGLAVIEDAAHAPAAWLDGRALGTWGDIGCFSFFSNKNLATGEGGMLLTGRPELAEKLRLLRSHGMTSLTWDRHNGHASSYDVVELGHNDRIDELRAALGRVQLAKLERNNARRGLITSQYWQALATTPLELPFRASVLAQARLNNPRAYRPAYHLFPLLLPLGLERERFVGRLKAAGVQTSLHYPPIHTFSYYRKHMPRISLPRTEVAAAREVTLPLFPTMCREQVEHVVEAVLAAAAETAW